MWWMLGLHEHSLPGRGRPCLTIAGRWRLWHGRPAPGLGVHRVSVPGCDLVVLGYCPAAEADLHRVANDVAAGEVDALDRVGGSRVVLAARHEEVLICGDLAGQRPVYYPRTPGTGLVAGSHARLVAANAGVPGAADVWWPRTPWRAVNVLRPGWTMRIARDGTTTQTCRVPLPLPGRSTKDAAAVLSESLRRAVASRVKAASRPTADFSGGLDSSTLAVLASADVDELPALTAATEGVDDAEVAIQAARQIPALRHRVITEPPTLLPYADLDRTPLTDEPWLGTVTGARERWWLGLVRSEGSDLHLSGDGGDGVLIATPAYLADLVSPRHGPMLWRHTVGWARLRHQAPHALIRAALALHSTSYAQACRDAARQLRSNAPVRHGWTRLISWFNVTGAADWATPEGRAVVADMLHEHAEANAEASVPGRMGVGDSAALLALHAFARQQRLDAEVAEQWSVNHHAPYLDDEVVRACWSVPAWQRTTPEQAKPLLRLAMGGTVPACVLDRRTKGNYTTPAYHGLRANVDTLRDLVNSLRLAEVGLVDRNKVMAELNRGINGHSIRLAAFDVLIGTEIWLRAGTATDPS